MSGLSRSRVRHDQSPITRYSAALLALVMLLAMLAPTEAAASHHRHRAKTTPASKSAASSDDDEGTIWEPEKSGLTGNYAEAVVLEPVSGTVIFEANDHQPWPTASLA